MTAHYNWWRCLHCGHGEYEEHEFTGHMQGVPMVHCASCKALHSPPDPHSHRALIAALRETKAALQLTALVESREDVGACIAEIISRLDHHLAASGTEARQRTDPEEGLDPKGDGPTLEERDAQTVPSPSSRERK